MAILPFVPFFALKDFGQMLIFSGAYTTLYLVAVRRWPQLLLFVGSVILVIGILVVAMPRPAKASRLLQPDALRIIGWAGERPQEPGRAYLLAPRNIFRNASRWAARVSFGPTRRKYQGPPSASMTAPKSRHPGWS